MPTTNHAQVAKVNVHQGIGLYVSDMSIHTLSDTCDVKPIASNSNGEIKKTPASICNLDSFSRAAFCMIAPGCSLKCGETWDDHVVWGVNHFILESLPNPKIELRNAEEL